MDCTDGIVEKALDLGTVYFKSGDFRKAKDVFKKALRLIKSYDEDQLWKIREEYGLSKCACLGELHDNCRVYHPRYVRVLDNLSATYEKLGESETALKYAQKMTSVEPYNLRCYIRCGKILQKLGRELDALNVYEKALDKVKTGEGHYIVDAPPRFLAIIDQQKNLIANRLAKSNRDNREEIQSSNPIFKRISIDPTAEQQRLLKKSKKSISKKFSEPIIVDFVQDLPLEIIPCIFKSFTSKELLKVALVCKNWRNIIQNLPEIFQSFILNRATYKDVLGFCNFASNFNLRCFWRPQGCLMELLKYSSRTASDELKSVEILLSRLRKLSFRKLILSVPNCNTAQFSKIVSKNKDLTENLEELSVVLSLRQDKPYESTILDSFPHLKRVEFFFDSSLVPITDEYARFHELKLNQGCAKTIETFKLICNQNKIKNFPFINLFSTFEINNISRLCITGVTLDHDACRFDWLLHFKVLKELWLENNKNAVFCSFMKIFRDFPVFGQLSSLTFREDSITSRFDLEDISESYFYRYNLENIQSLDIMGTSISGMGLRRLVSYLNQDKLKKINFGDCPYIRIQRILAATDAFALSPFHFFTYLPNIEELNIPQLGTLSDENMKILRLEINNMKRLKRIDISLNPSITGVAIYDLLKALKELRSIPLDHLNMDGCTSVSHITINTLKSLNLVKQVECAYERETWRKFGVNSFKYQK